MPGWTRSRTRRAAQLKGQAAIANARLAYQAYQELIASQRWQQLARLGSSAAAPAVGIHRRQEPRLPRHHVRNRAGRRRTPSTPCRVPPSRPSPTTARSAGTPSAAGTTRRGAYLTSSRRSASTSMTSPRSWNATASAKFEKSWNELSTTIAAELHRSHPDRQS